MLKSKRVEDIAIHSVLKVEKRNRRFSELRFAYSVFSAADSFRLEQPLFDG